MRSRKGFTLIELLLAISLIGIVSTMLYSVFWGGIKMSYKSEAVKAVNQEAWLTIELISKELENAIVYNFENSYSDKSTFEGYRNRISFLLPVDGEIKSVSYYLIDTNAFNVFKTEIGATYQKNVEVRNSTEEEIKKQTLVRKEQSLMAYVLGGFVGDSDNEQIEIIATHLSSDGFTLEYGNAQASDDTSFTWDKKWVSNDLPVSVKLNLTFVSDSTNTIDVSKEIFLPAAQGMNVL